MNKHRHILLLIALVIAITTGIQLYWNFKNYEASKQQVLNEVQIALDNTIESYFVHLAKNSSMDIILKDESHMLSSNQWAKRFSPLKRTLKKVSKDSLLAKRNDSLKVDLIHFVDSIAKDSSNSTNKVTQIEIFSDSDSIPLNIKNLVSKTFIAIRQDSLSISKVDSLMSIELKRKNLDVTYGLKFEHFGKTQTLRSEYINSSYLTSTSNSPYLPHNTLLELYFSNPVLTIFKKNSISLLLSFSLIISVIFSLFYLLRIINHQKQLSEIKNDLISNITHEFKTPIATIKVALEAILNFNDDNDPKKTQKYIAMSNLQLSKLHLMVEKLLETATLDSNALVLNKESHNLVELLENVIAKHNTLPHNKDIKFNSISPETLLTIDIFHFENAINNIIDNAVKYGGEMIWISMDTTDTFIEIIIADNGTDLAPQHKNKIFEKFYRVPKGNTHDVKGFGIGLYYTKTIIEKHQGTIEISLENRLTTFKIKLPNEH